MIVRYNNKKGVLYEYGWNKKLNPKERIILINDIWESLESENITVESPSWHKQVLDERIKKMENNEARYVSLEELKNRWM